MKIGNIELKYGLALAPMAGVTDHSFRKICRLYGAEYTVSEMVSSKAMHYKDRKTAVLAKLYEDDIPMAVQIFGCEPEIMKESAEMLCNNSYRDCESDHIPSAIDINAGCPVKKVTSNGEGCALMKSPSLLYKIVSEVKKVSCVPVTVKIRAGFDKEHINALDCARAIEEAGADMICVHGRTREQFYAPPVDLDIIAKVKDSVKIPVMGNGGIYTPDDALKMLEYTHCDGIMIAQGSLGNPFLFENIKRRIENEPERTVSKEEKCRILKEHLSLLIEEKGEFIGISEARKHIGWYSAFMRDSALFRDEINRAENKEKVFSLIEDFFGKDDNC